MNEYFLYQVLVKTIDVSGKKLLLKQFIGIIWPVQ